MKKKILSLILISTVAFNFMGCSSNKDESESSDNTITVQVESTWLPYYEKIRENVIKDIEGANIEFVEVGSFDHLEILEQTDPTNPDIADVFALPADAQDKLHKNQSLAVIDAEAMAERVGGFKDFKAGLGGTFNIDGEYVAFPFNIETLVGYVNVENAKNAGIDITKNFELTDLNYEQMLVLPHDCWYGVAFANSVDLELLGKNDDGTLYSDVTKEYKDLTEDQQKLFEALFNYWKEHDENKTDLWDKEAAGGYLDSSFTTGEGNAVRIDGPWAAANLTSMVGGEENLEVIPLNNITVNGKSLKHWKSGWGIGINSRIEEDEAKMELAVAFIEELVNPENAVDLFNATGKILENVEPAAYDSVDKMSKKVIDATYDSYNTAMDKPYFSEWDNVWDSWQNALLSWSSTKPKNVEEAYLQVKASFEAMLESIK